MLPKSRTFEVCRFVLITILLFAARASVSQAVQGDVNGDGIVDYWDARAIVNHLTERTSLTGAALTRADANSDGKVTMADVVWINNHQEITINVTPNRGLWSLSGPTGFTTLTGMGDRLGAQAILTPIPGNYTLTCNDLYGYRRPSPQTGSLSARGTLGFTASWTPEEISINLPGNVPLVLVPIPPGSFQMGSPDTERSRTSYEGPVHAVTIQYGFYMGKCEVTQRQWLALMGSWAAGGEWPDCGLGENYPAYGISWNDAQNFISALNTHITNTGQGPATFRLPSEAEWEYACRAGTQTRFFFGDSLSVDDDAADGPAGTLPGNRSDYMWWKFNCQGDANGAKGSKPVGTKLPNQFGLYDMSGNVHEWCQDHWHENYIGAPSDGSAWESPMILHRLFRGGGSWGITAKDCRSATRYAYINPHPAIGFRLARTSPDQQEITIDVTPDGGSWSLSGPTGFTTLTGTGDRLGAQAILNPPPGNYTLICNDNLFGYNRPSPQTRSLAAGGTLTFTASWTREITINLPGDVPLVLVRIPAGSFQMGSPDTERSRRSNEGPTHTVTINYAFYMGKYELTQIQWLALMGSWPHEEPSNWGVGDNYPAAEISWSDCQSFVAALNTHITNTNQGPATFRLPSEAEWEYACRAGTQTRFFFGDSLSTGDSDDDVDGPAGTLPGNRSDYMWYWRTYFPPYIKRVGTKLPNQFGLYDMSGNVWEWCQDWWHSDYSQAGRPDNGSAWETQQSGYPYRVCRGGGWSNYAFYCRSALRVHYGPDRWDGDLGFRLVRTEANSVITIDVTPNGGSWSLSGPAGFTTLTGTGDRLGAQAILTPLPGNYTLTCNDNVPGYNPPSPQTRSVAAEGTLAFTATWRPEEITINLPGNVPLVLVRVPAGSFQMGSPATERSRYSDEGPVHGVTINYAFYMGKYELTQRQWLAVMNSWPHGAPDSYGVGDNYPAYYISWNDCRSFIAALNTHITNTSQGPATFRLPSEAEWEYACRAGTQTRFFFGDSLSVGDSGEDGPAGTLPGKRSDYMWYYFNFKTPTYGSKQVGTKLPNQFGLHDMSGNVWEWCQDWWHDSYVGAPTNGSAWEFPAGISRVVRSGDWGRDANACRSAIRSYFTPANWYYNIGVRLLRTP